MAHRPVLKIFKMEVIKVTEVGVCIDMGLFLTPSLPQPVKYPG